MNKLFCVVFFNPAQSDIDFYTNIEGHDFAFIVNDATSVDLYSLQKFNILHSGENIGLSKAYNVFLKYALDNNYEFFITFDQDSRFDLKELSKYENYRPYINDAVTGVYWSKSTNVNSLVDWVISSGSLYDTKIISNVGGFDEYYFIDRVDVDLCYSVRSQGYNVRNINLISLKHSVGGSEEKKFSVPIDHSPIREYYIFRNRMYFYSKFSTIFDMRLLLSSLKQVLFILFFHKHKMKKIRYIFSAFFDYFEFKS